MKKDETKTEVQKRLKKEFDKLKHKKYTEEELKEIEEYKKKISVMSAKHMEESKKICPPDMPVWKWDILRSLDVLRGICSSFKDDASQ